MARRLNNKGEQKKSKSKNSKLKSSRFSKLFKRISSKNKRYHIPLPNNKAGKILGKRVPIIPGFLKNAFNEIKLTTWPGRKETARLTLAVFIFAILFGIFVAGLDFVLDKIFKELVL